MSNKKHLTWRQIKTFLDNYGFDLDTPVRWMGDERGGICVSVETINATHHEDLYITDEGIEPCSAFEEGEVSEDWPVLPKETPIIWVD